VFGVVGGGGGGGEGLSPPVAVGNMTDCCPT